MNKSLKNDFIIKALKVHEGKKYDYSMVEYIKSTVRVKILCPKHGVFEQTPTRHLSSKGCPKCTHELSSLNRTKSNDCFIKECKKVHDSFYSYHNTIYKNKDTKVIITCPIHGDFIQVASSHLNGNGCKECAKIKMRNLFQHTTDQFKERVYNEYGEDSYDLSQVVYKGAYEKVKIVCKHHGMFMTNPNDFLNKKSKCPACKEITKVSSRQGVDCIEDSKNIGAYLYIIEFENCIKVGISTKINKRIHSLRNMFGYFTDVFYISTNLYEAVKKENDILRDLYLFNMSNVVKNDGKTECFPKYFKNYIIRKYFKWWIKV